MLEKYSGPATHIHIVSSILDYCEKENNFAITIEEFAAKHKISTRTLQRYFEITTSLSGKRALQIMRIRKAVTHLVNSPNNFHYLLYGYYDHSHFYKHLKQFLNKKRLRSLQPHLRLLETIHK
jgi:transcriptional regulator GlxA family with amidase domain